MGPLIMGVFALGLAVGGMASGFVPAAKAETHPGLRAAIAEDYPYLEDLFKHFHRNPELSLREEETAKRFARELRQLGITVTEGVGGTGVVGVLENGDGPTVLLRADMDGLPVKELVDLPYKSTRTQVDTDGIEKPVMHACGHDAHMVSLIGSARRLVAMKDQWSGTIVFVGQPAEERIVGARMMIEDGLYERFPRPDYVVGHHVFSPLAAGKVYLKPGLMLSSSDGVDITVRGIGSHGASPQNGKDPVVIAAQIVLALQTLVSRELGPLEPGVVTVGKIEGGTKRNIIGEEVKLYLTVRSNSEETRKKLLSGIERIAVNTGRTAGLPEDRLPVVTLIPESTGITMNDPALTEVAVDAFKAQLGEENVQNFVQKSMGAEDFHFFHAVEPPIPGLFFRVGGTSQERLDEAAAGGKPVPAHHSPIFMIEPEPSIKTGVEANTAILLHLLKP